MSFGLKVLEQIMKEQGNLPKVYIRALYKFTLMRQMYPSQTTNWFASTLPPFLLKIIHATSSWISIRGLHKINITCFVLWPMIYATLTRDFVSALDKIHIASVVLPPHQHGFQFLGFGPNKHHTVCFSTKIKCHISMEFLPCTFGPHKCSDLFLWRAIVCGGQSRDYHMCAKPHEHRIFRLATNEGS